jgi:hypothetical protein
LLMNHSPRSELSRQTARAHAPGFTYSIIAS